MKPKAMRPVMMKAMPRPLSALGTREYFIRSRIAAMEAMARAQPMPEPKP